MKSNWHERIIDSLIWGCFVRMYM